MCKIKLSFFYIVHHILGYVKVFKTKLYPLFRLKTSLKKLILSGKTRFKKFTLIVRYDLEIHDKSVRILAIRDPNRALFQSEELPAVSDSELPHSADKPAVFWR